MVEILVTGGTGTLGRALVARLREQGYEPRVLSRRPGPGRTIGDLETGAGIAEAVRGVDVVVHAASRAGGHDVAQARTLIEALHAEALHAEALHAEALHAEALHAEALHAEALHVDRAGDERSKPHLLFVSIVGVDRVPLPYYRHKVQVERMIAESGLPWTVLRATQFHDLFAMLFGVLGPSPVLPVLAGAWFQPVDVRDVAERLVALAVAGPAGRATDLAGPQVRSMADLARTWAAATGRRRAVLPVPLPGRVSRAIRKGGLLDLEHAEGRTTFDEFLAARAPVAR
jgi:uncharacterized protein YbjT (DUF2867 family)